MKQIVCMSTSNFYPLPTRKQQIMTRLQDAEILYFNPPVTLLAPLKDKSLLKRQKHIPKPKENIKVFDLPFIFPFYNKFRWINKINQGIIAGFVKKQMKKAGFQNPILWCYSPMSCDLVGKIKHKALIYDCVDRHSAYPGMINPDVVNKMEKDLATKCNAVFATAIGLYETLKGYNKNTFLIPNGVNFEHFNKATGSLDIPEDIKSLPRPIIGFSGMLQECIDYAAIVEIAKAHPEWSLVMIGKPLPGVDVSILDSYQNIHRLGLRPYDKMPNYLSAFDVCLNNFAPGKLTKDVSPLKFYEYLATGKPIVSGPEPLQVLDYQSIIYIANSPAEYPKLCEKALSEHNEERKNALISKGLACSWENRVLEINSILENSSIF